jgi:hypothetical protein
MGGSSNRRSPRSGTCQLRNLKKLFAMHLPPLAYSSNASPVLTYKKEEEFFVMKMVVHIPIQWSNWCLAVVGYLSLALNMFKY